jgi:hypothetical protein
MFRLIFVSAYSGQKAQRDEETRQDVANEKSDS